MRETMDEKTEALEIDLQKLLMVYFSKWWLILLCGLAVACGVLLYTAKCITPLYRASVSIYVNNIRSNQQIDYLSDSNLAASQRLVNTYINIARSDRVLEKVSQELNGDYSAADLGRMFSAAQVDETEIFTISISSPDPEEAARVANAMAEIAPEEISGLIEGSSARVIDYAKVPEFRYTPSYRKNTLLGGMVGCFLAVAYLTLVYLLDVRIRDEEDLSALVDLPVLGQIPNIDTIGSVNKKKYGYETAAPKIGRGGRL